MEVGAAPRPKKGRAVINYTLRRRTWSDLVRLALGEGS